MTAENPTKTKKLKARVYDKSDDAHVADLYTYEAIAECQDCWWMRVEEVENDE